MQKKTIIYTYTSTQKLYSTLCFRDGVKNCWEKWETQRYSSKEVKAFNRNNIIMQMAFSSFHSFISIPHHSTTKVLKIVLKPLECFMNHDKTQSCIKCFDS